MTFGELPAQLSGVGFVALGCRALPFMRYSLFSFQLQKLAARQSTRRQSRAFLQPCLCSK